MTRTLWLLAGLFPALLVVASGGSSVTPQSAEKVANTEEAFVRVEGMTRRNGIL